jgi:exodeoxyribonuclease V alpha subunit
VERFGWTFCPGDKVMQVQNDYDRDVYNGDLGTVSGIDPQEGDLVVRFDGREVTYGFGELDESVLAYAITIHKSQGSEYPAVVIPLMTQHYAMLARNLLYTAVTRPGHGGQLVHVANQEQRRLIRQRRSRLLRAQCPPRIRRWVEQSWRCGVRLMALSVSPLIPHLHLAPPRAGLSLGRLAASDRCPRQCCSLFVPYAV